MRNVKEDFLNPGIRNGGFFELAIQVSPSLELKPIKAYKNFIWSLPEIEGPFDKDMKSVTADYEAFREEGLLNLETLSIPFVMHFIQEEPLESGFNWLSISFYTGTLNTIFGVDYLTFEGEGELPQTLDCFLNRLMRNLNAVYPFLLALKDFEISGEYYLEDLKHPNLENWTNSHFFVPESQWQHILPTYYLISTMI